MSAHDLIDKGLAALLPQETHAHDAGLYAIGAALMGVGTMAIVEAVEKFIVPIDERDFVALTKQDQAILEQHIYGRRPGVYVPEFDVRAGEVPSIEFEGAADALELAKILRAEWDHSAPARVLADRIELTVLRKGR